MNCRFMACNGPCKHNSHVKSVAMLPTRLLIVRWHFLICAYRAGSRYLRDSEVVLWSSRPHTVAIHPFMIAFSPYLGVNFPIASSI